MRGFTSLLWPIRYKPFPEELLSSWLVRLAHGHGLKVQTFCNQLFGNRLQVWNRDIDRLGPEWLVKELSLRTGTPLEVAQGTTLRAYEGFIFPAFRSSGAIPWVQTLQMYHRKRMGFGLQFCPHCLNENQEPYFRKSWRLTYNTLCIKHDCLLHDRCPDCGAGLAFHRLDVGNQGATLNESLAICHRCGFDLRLAESQAIISYDTQAIQWHRTLCEQTVNWTVQQSHLNLETLAVLRQLTYLLVTSYKTVSLRGHVCEQLLIPNIPVTAGRVAIESRPLSERHHLMQLVAWLVVDLEPRMQAAWRSKAIRYNLMAKDFEDAPQWYLEMVERFSDWRSDTIK